MFLNQSSFWKLSIHRWVVLLKEKKYRISLLAGFLLMFLALYVNIELSQLTSTFQVLAVGDLILDHIPTYNLNFIYTFGAYLVILTTIIYPLIFKPEFAPFALKTFSFFVIIRAFFINLTHIGPHVNMVKIHGTDTFFLNNFFYENDFFFSAHTGIPFLAFLIFYRENKPLSYFFLVASFVMGTTVLLMHLHYSIDVFGAFFITYSIYKVSDQIFNKLYLSFKKAVAKFEEKRKEFTDRFPKLPH